MIDGHLCAILEPTTDIHAYWEPNPVLTKALGKFGVVSGFVTDKKVQLGRRLWSLRKETLPSTH